MNIELAARRDCGDVAEEFRPPGAVRVGNDALGLKSLAKGEPSGTGAVIVHRRVDGPLEQVLRVRRQTADPGIEENDRLGVSGLTKLDETELITSENDLEVRLGIEGVLRIVGTCRRSSIRWRGGGGAVRRAGPNEQSQGGKQGDCKSGAHRSSGRRVEWRAHGRGLHSYRRVQSTLGAAADLAVMAA